VNRGDVYLGELKVVDIVLQVVGDGGNHAGLSSSRGSIEQVPTLPSASDFVEKLLSSHERIQISLHFGLELRLHGERVEVGRVLEAVILPVTIVVAVQRKLPQLAPELHGVLSHVIKILVHHKVLVSLPKLQLKLTLLVFPLPATIIPTLLRFVPPIYRHPLVSL